METASLISVYFFIAVVLVIFILLILSTSVQALWMVPFIPTPKAIIDGMVEIADLKPGRLSTISVLATVACSSLRRSVNRRYGGSDTRERSECGFLQSFAS